MTFARNAVYIISSNHVERANRTVIDTRSSIRISAQFPRARVFVENLAVRKKSGFESECLNWNSSVDKNTDATSIVYSHRISSKSVRESMTFVRSIIQSMRSLVRISQADDRTMDHFYSRQKSTLFHSWKLDRFGKLHTLIPCHLPIWE